MSPDNRKTPSRAVHLAIIVALAAAAATPLAAGPAAKRPLSLDDLARIRGVGGEQMCQALKSLGVPTELVVYTGRFHGIATPNCVRDRYERCLAWFDRYLKAKG